MGGKVPHQAKFKQITKQSQIGAQHACYYRWCTCAATPSRFGQFFNSNYSQIRVRIEHQMDVQFLPNSVIPIICANLGGRRKNAAMGIATTIPVGLRWFCKGEDDVTRSHNSIEFAVRQFLFRSASNNKFARTFACQKLIAQLRHSGRMPRAKASFFQNIGHGSRAAQVSCAQSIARPHLLSQGSLGAGCKFRPNRFCGTCIAMNRYGKSRKRKSRDADKNR